MRTFGTIFAIIAVAVGLFAAGFVIYCITKGEMAHAILNSIFAIADFVSAGVVYRSTH